MDFALPQKLRFVALKGLAFRSKTTFWKIDIAAIQHIKENCRNGVSVSDVHLGAIKRGTKQAHKQLSSFRKIKPPFLIFYI